jgi:hypothetical protein
MKKILIAAASVGLAAASLGFTASSASAAPSCNWGQLTSDAIAGGFNQGEHASSFAGSPRVGLANVVERGNLAATCELLS